MSRKIFYEFMRFFLQDLSHLKIKTKFKFELFPGFFIQHTEGFGSSSKKESCSVMSPSSHQKVSRILEIGKSTFSNFEVGRRRKSIKIKNFRGAHLSVITLSPSLSFNCSCV
jgi:hypothetical protein